MLLTVLSRLGSGSRVVLTHDVAQRDNLRVGRHDGVTAVIEALASLKRSCDVVVYLDSEYVRKGITEWIINWQRRGWKTADGKPVKNAELWQRLDALRKLHHVEWRWVKGHAGDPGNERADALANKGVASLSKVRAT